MKPEADSRELRQFTRRLLRDMRALEELLEGGLVETGVRRIGAEQELFLVDRSWRPASLNLEVLEQLDDPRATSELGRFNLEFNTDPLLFEEDCLSRLHAQLEEMLERARRAARRCGAEILLTGILPTLRKSDLTLENMTPMERYRVLNEALRRLRGGAFDFYIRGTDELHLQHDSMMVEAANTSFQVHFQVDPGEFARLYNVALAVTAPVLAAAVNSPILFGKRLWRETRIALFQQSIDTRKAPPGLREIPSRVHFGQQWVEDSVLEIFREDIARYRVLISTEAGEDPFDAIREGRAPELRALQLHNSTVYRWNRPCYGISPGGKAHLRIENRVLPSGPTLVDEIANAAFWFGLMSGVAEEHEDIRDALDFDDARGNFVAAARLGLGSELTWTGGTAVPAGELIRERLLPLAREGLSTAGIAAEDAERYLGVIEDRIRSKQTGTDWLLGSLAGMDRASTPEERLRAATGAMAARQRTGEPVHTWDPARLDEGGGWEPSYFRLEGYMTTDLLTVHEDEPVDLVANLMDWHGVRYIPVEDDEHHLIGLVSDRLLLGFFTGDEAGSESEPVAVGEIMLRDLVTAPPEMSTLEAIEKMREEKVACLPIVKEGKLVGLVTEGDFVDIAGQLLQERLKEDGNG